MNSISFNMNFLWKSYYQIRVKDSKHFNSFERFYNVFILILIKSIL